MDKILQFDAQILLWIQEHLRQDFLNPILIFITHLGDAGIFWIVLTVFLLLSKSTRRTGSYTAAALIISLLINNCLLKNLVARTRPYEVVDGLTRLIEKQKDYSFPSGHTASSFVAATVIFCCLPKKYSWLALLLAGLIAFSRLYVGVHYPSDVLFGLLSGILIGLFCVYLYRRKEHEVRSNP